MEKVKLPNEICKALDSYKFRDNKSLFIWSAMQTESIHEGHSLYLVRKYIDDNNNSNAITIVNAILYGYEPEETEEERKERDIKQKMLDFINDSSNKFMLNKDYVDFLYDIARCKK